MDTGEDDGRVLTDVIAKTEPTDYNIIQSSYCPFHNQNANCSVSTRQLSRNLSQDTIFISHVEGRSRPILSRETPNIQSLFANSNYLQQTNAATPVESQLFSEVKIKPEPVESDTSMCISESDSTEAHSDSQVFHQNGLHQSRLESVDNNLPVNQHIHVAYCPQNIDDADDPFSQDDESSPEFTSGSSVQSLEKSIPRHTKHVNKWAVSVFNSWRKWRQSQPETIKDRKLPIPDLTGPADRLNYWLARFIYEVRRKDNTPYPSGSLNNIACGLQRHMKATLNRNDVHLFRREDPSFLTFRNSMAKRQKELVKSGVGVRKKFVNPRARMQADEDLLWDNNVFNLETGEGLSYAVYFYNCKVFGLKGAETHVNLTTRQFQLCTDNKGRKYLDFERISQRTGDVAHIKEFSHPGNPRCVVSIFEKYLGLIQPGRFYKRPLPNRGKTISFSLQSVGLNSLAKYMWRILELANIDLKAENSSSSDDNQNGNSSNHGSGEQFITSTSGHSSMERPLEDRVTKLPEDLQPSSSKTISEHNQDKMSDSTTTTTCKPGQSIVKTQTKDIDVDNVLTIKVPSSITKVVIEKQGKIFTFDL